MTRQKWTTKEQEAWLEERKPAFFLANQRKAAWREFFPQVLQEFRDKWSPPALTQEEINKAGSLELATKVQKEKYDKVYLLLRVRVKLTSSYSAHLPGFITSHGRSMGVMRSSP
jgi:hypothetical protein